MKMSVWSSSLTVPSPIRLDISCDERDTEVSAPPIATRKVTAKPAMGPEIPRSKSESRFAGGSPDFMTAPKVGRKPGSPGMKYG